MVPLPSYPEPQQPGPFWPVAKPPTLHQMEADMKLWARAGHEIRAKSEHAGRMHEWQRAKAAFSDLVRRDEALRAQVAALRERVRQFERQQRDEGTRVGALEAECMDKEGQLAEMAHGGEHTPRVCAAHREI